MSEAEQLDLALAASFSRPTLAGCCLFKRPVDLVVDSAIRNPHFREAVDLNKALLDAA